jgi:phosphonate transport system substrate-binding protein
MNRPVHCASYLASNWFGFYEAIAQFLQRVLKTDTDIVQRPCDPLDDPLLPNDKFDIILLCGLPFIRHYAQHPTQLQPIVAPVMQAVRYGDRLLRASAYT